MKEIIVLLVTVSTLVWTQDVPSMLNLFPHHTGDIWEYYDPNWPNAPLDQNKILADTLSTDGRYYITTSKDGYYIFDTVNAFVYHSNHNFLNLSTFELRYKLNADSGDWWVAYQDSFGRKTVQISDVFYTYVWNATPILCKRFDFYLCGSRDSLLELTSILALGYGVIAQNFDTFPFRRIKGTFINGELHGTVTSVKNEDFTPIEYFTLYQNYPNPFNGATVIKFTLSQSVVATIKIYNSIGQTIERKDFGQLGAGEHYFNWNGDGYSSGIYFYEVIINNFIQRKKMVSLR